jgi:hypothetical protein
MEHPHEPQNTGDEATAICESTCVPNVREKKVNKKYCHFFRGGVRGKTWRCGTGMGEDMT